MQTSRYAAQSSSESSSTTNTRSTQNRSKSPTSSQYEYVGRLVTRERPISRDLTSTQQSARLPSNQQRYHHSTGSHRRPIYEELPVASDDEEIDDLDGLSRPVGIIRINDRHFREIYRLPTPPPKVKRVYHRLRSPEPKIIERVYVRRPPPQIIENVIEVPPEKVKIIHREKYLDNAKPITRSKLVHLKSHRDHEQEQPPQAQQTYLPSQQSTRSTVPLQTSQQSGGQSTTLIYPPQANLRTVGYIQSDIPPHIMLNSQQHLQLPTQTSVAPQMTQPTPYEHPMSAGAYPPQMTQMIQPSPYDQPMPGGAYPPQMFQPTPYDQPMPGAVYPQQPQTIPYSLYGYKQQF